MKTEQYYSWKIFDQEEQRFLTIHADPMEYEDPFDWIFESVQEAKECLTDLEYEEEAKQCNWILCKVTIEPVNTN